MANYEIGRTYVDNLSDEIVVFLGYAIGADENGEDIGVFQIVDSPGQFLLDTKRGHDQGQLFEPFGDRVADELDP